jgi:hypothetical protein
MQHTTLCTPWIAFMLASHMRIIVIGHTEEEREEQPEPAPIEGGNYEHLTTILELIIHLYLN